MKVQELMTAEVIACGPQESLNEVARRMWEHDLGCMPVVDGLGHVVGMLTDRDVCMAVYTRGARLQDLTAAQTMATQVVTCAEDDDVLLAAELMGTHQVQRLPVLGEAGDLRGLVTLGDLARACESASGQRVKRALVDRAAATLTEIHRPRTAPPVPATPPIEEIASTLA